jgi:hypothetical protein
MRRAALRVKTLAGVTSNSRRSSEPKKRLVHVQDQWRSPSDSSNDHSLGPLVGSITIAPAELPRAIVNSPRLRATNYWSCVCSALAGLSIRCVERDVPRDRPLPAIAIREQAFLVVVELLGCLSRELEIRSQDNGVNRAGLLTEAAVDAFHHIDVEAGGAARAVVTPRPRLNGDSLRRADCLTQLAGDAAFLSARITTQCKLAAKAGRERPLLERIVQRHLRPKEVAHRQQEGGNEVYQKDRPGCFMEPPWFHPVGLQ